MFIAALVGCIAYVAVSIMRFISLKVIELLRPSRGQGPMITMMRIIAIVDMAVEAVRTVEPGSSSNKCPAHKPIWPIVAIGRAVIRSVVEIPVRTHRSHSNVDGNLRRCEACAA